jgi:hypothetical protein
MNGFHLAYVYLPTRFLQTISYPLVCFILPLSKDALSPEQVVCGKTEILKGKDLKQMIVAYLKVLS